jgi:hypothetical protein
VNTRVSTKRRTSNPKPEFEQREELEPKETDMNTLQRLTSKLDDATTSHLCEAAEILARRGDMEAAHVPLLDAAVEVLGDSSERLQAIADLLLTAMSVQIAACWDTWNRRTRT